MRVTYKTLLLVCNLEYVVFEYLKIKQARDMKHM